VNGKSGLQQSGIPSGAIRYNCKTSVRSSFAHPGPEETGRNGKLLPENPLWGVGAAPKKKKTGGPVSTGIYVSVRHNPMGWEIIFGVGRKGIDGGDSPPST